MSVDAKKDTFQAHPVEDVERALDLEVADREDLPGLYRFNVVKFTNEGSIFTIAIPCDPGIAGRTGRSREG
jgi:hypothetical protein